MAYTNPIYRPDPNQNIDDQIVFNQSPDAIVVFLNLDDRGRPIRDLANAAVVPDIDDIMSISLQMGSTGTMGRFTIKINNDNSKYLRPDDMEQEIVNLNAGQIILVTDAENKVTYNTLPAGVTWGDVKTFLNRTAYNRIRNDPPLIHLYYREPADTYGDTEINNLQTSEAIKEELRKGAIKFRSIPADKLAEFAKANSFSSTQKGDNTDASTEASSISTTFTNQEKVAAAMETSRAAREVALARTTVVNAEADRIVAFGEVEALDRPIENRTEGTTTVTNSQTSTSAGRQDTSTSLSTNVNEGRLTVAQAKSLLEQAKPHSAFFEEFGGQLEHGRNLFEPMQLCMVFMSRRFRDNQTSDDMTVAFTGYVDSVSDGFDGTSHVISIAGSDVTKIMNITQANINPSLFLSKLPSANQYKIWQNRFGGLEGWEIIQLLTVGGEFDQAEGAHPGDRIHGAGSFDVRFVASPDDPQKFDRNEVDFSSVYDPHISRTVLLNGISKTSAEVTRDEADRLERLFFTPQSVHIQALPFDNSPVSDLQSYDVFKKIFGMSFGNWQNDYQSHYELATQVARLTNYEFYADANGHVWYHQPRFHNYHILTHTNPEIYVLRDEDIVNCNLTESDQDVITSVYVVGSPNFYTGPKEPVKMVGFYEDPSLVLKYGRRMLTTSHPFVVSEGDINFFARSYLIRVNAARYVGTVNIIGRPELRMHMPVYIPFRNMVYYIEGIQHNFTMGQQFTTTLTLRYGRKPWEVLPEILDYTDRANPNLSSQGVVRDEQTPTVKEEQKTVQDEKTARSASGRSPTNFPITDVSASGVAETYRLEDDPPKTYRRADDDLLRQVGTNKLVILVEDSVEKDEFGKPILNYQVLED